MTLIGHTDARAAFDAAISGDTLHHAWLLAGPEGVGKATFARDAAARLLVPDGNPALLGQIATGSHPDYRELRRLPKDPEKPDQDIARSIPVAQVRTLLPMFATWAARRVIVIDTADDLERPGAGNALLKTLEEPAAGTTFLLVSHAPGRLLPTIRSRCRLLRFGRLSDMDVAAVLRNALPAVADSERAALTVAAEGSPGRAVALAGLDLPGIDSALAAIAGDGDPANARRAALAKALALKSAAPRYELFLDRAPRFIAAQAKARSGSALRHALDLYDSARRLAISAPRMSLDPQGTVFELAGLVAALARR